MEQLQKDPNWRPILCPAKHPNPPRERPVMFYSVLTLLYTQFGITRKLRHFITCVHNVAYHAIDCYQKRQLYAAGSICRICPYCPKMLYHHTHSNIHGCPGNGVCPTVREITPGRFNHVYIDHLCLIHQNTVPHPLDLDTTENLPIPHCTPFQFTFHTTAPHDSLLIVQALSDSTGINNPHFSDIMRQHSQNAQRQINVPIDQPLTVQTQPPPVYQPPPAYPILSTALQGNTTTTTTTIADPTITTASHSITAILRQTSRPPLPIPLPEVTQTDSISEFKVEDEPLDE